MTVTLHLNDATGLAAQITRAAADEGIVRFGLIGRKLALPGNMNMDLHIGASLRYMAEVESYGFNTGINAENLSQIMQFGSVNIQ